MSGGKGRREGTRTASHNKHLRNKRKNNEGREQAREHTTSRQNKGRKKRGGRKHTGTQPWHAEEQIAQSGTGNKAKHNSKTTEAG